MSLCISTNCQGSLMKLCKLSCSLLLRPFDLGFWYSQFTCSMQVTGWMEYHLPPLASTFKIKNSGVASGTGWGSPSTVPLTPALNAMTQRTSLETIRLDVEVMQTDIMPSVMLCLLLPSQQHSPLLVKLMEWSLIHSWDQQTFFFPTGIVIVLLLSTFRSRLFRTLPYAKLLAFLVMLCKLVCNAN